MVTTHRYHGDWEHSILEISQRQFSDDRSTRGKFTGNTWIRLIPGNFERGEVCFDEFKESESAEEE
jgi:hypothetical protein